MSYRFVPAAIDYKSCGIGVYIKYGETGKKHVTVKQNDSNYIWLVCPDR